MRCFGYDPHNAKDFVARWEAENGPFGVEKVIHGAKTESMPLGELKKLSEERMEKYYRAQTCTNFFQMHWKTMSLFQERH